MFGLFKKKSKPEIKRGTEAPVAPFEILLPEELTQGQIPDLRIGSKVLDILRANSNDVQTLEVFEGMPVGENMGQAVSRESPGSAMFNGTEFTQYFNYAIKFKR